MPSVYSSGCSDLKAAGLVPVLPLFPPTPRVSSYGLDTTLPTCSSLSHAPHPIHKLLRQQLGSYFLWCLLEALRHPDFCCPSKCMGNPLIPIIVVLKVDVQALMVYLSSASGLLAGRDCVCLVRYSEQ